MSLLLPAVLGGRYELLEEIGSGAYAAVYRAHDHVLDRAVAVKVLRDEITSDETFVRFEREVHVTATLEHAHILHVHDSGKHEGRPYIVTELAPGGTLSEKLAREGQLDIATALQITCEVGLALAHAHASGVVHRDVKPDNILLGRGGVLLADFGIAISDTNEFLTRLTQSGMAVGTVQYMSPEQLCAERVIDGRSDQYSLACILYEMLAGVRPHSAATMEALRLQRMAAQHLPVRAHRPSVPQQIDAAIHKALCSMAADRHRDIPAFLSALGMAGSGEFALMSAVTPPSSGATRDKALSAKPLVTHAKNGKRYASRQVYIAGVMGLTGALALAVVAFATRQSDSEALTSGDHVRVLLAPPLRSDTNSVDVRVHEALLAELSGWPAAHVANRRANGDTAVVQLFASVAEIGDSVRISMRVQRGGDNRDQRDISAAMVPANASFAPLAAQLIREALAGASDLDAPGMHDLPVRSLSALSRYVEAHRLLRSGLLDSAASAFRSAASVAATTSASNMATRFAQAHFWAAQADAWRDPLDTESWRGDMELAASSGRLHGTDSLLALALQRMASAEFPAACSHYRTATLLQPGSFAAWFGLGECARVDPLVEVRNGQPRFRSSTWSALTAYRTAVETAPTPELLAAVFPAILKATYADGSRVRVGEATGQRYSALPSLDHDTLAFFPIAQSAVAQMQTGTVPPTFAAAVRRGRSIALDLTERWIRRSSDAPEAWLFRAFALELTGRLAGGGDEAASALTALDRAAVGTPSAELRARTAVARTRVLLRQGEMKQAVLVASAALDDTSARNAASARLLAPLAALLGDVTRLESLLPPTSSENLPSSMVAALDAFNIRAWLGSCDELAGLQRVLEDRARSSFAPNELAKARELWLAPAYRAAVPCLGPSAIAGFDPQIPLDRAYNALAAKDQIEARRIIEEARAQRGGASTSGVSWDYLFAESWALAAAGDTTSARRQLVSALEDIGSMSGLTMDYVPVAAGLRLGLLLLRDLSVGAETDAVVMRWSDRASVLLNQKSRGSTQ